MRKMFEKDSFYVPNPEKTHERTKDMSFFLVGDKIFLLKHWLMRPYAGKQLTDQTRKQINFRLSWTRRIREYFWYFGIKMEILSEDNRRYLRKDRENRSYIYIRLKMHTILWQSSLIQRIVMVRLLQDNGVFITNSLHKVCSVRNSGYQGNTLELQETLVEYFISESGLIS